MEEYIKKPGDEVTTVEYKGRPVLIVERPRKNPDKTFFFVPGYLNDEMKLGIALVTPINDPEDRVELTDRLGQKGKKVHLW